MMCASSNEERNAQNMEVAWDGGLLMIFYVRQ